MNQDNTRDARESIRVSLQAFSVASFVFQSAVAARAHLHPTDLHAISWLSMRPDGSTASELARELDLTSGATTTAIDRLVALTYVERVTDPIDRRRVRIRLQPSGLSGLRDEYAQVDSSVDSALAALSDTEAAVIARFLATLTTVATGNPPAETQNALPKESES